MFYFSNGEDDDVEDGDGIQRKSSRKSSKDDEDNEDDSKGDVDESYLDDDIPLGDEKPSKKSSSSKPKKQEEDEDDDDLEEDEEEDEKPQSKSKSRKEEEEDEEEEDSDDEEDEDDEKDRLSSINLVALDLIDKGILTPKEGEKYKNSDVGLAKLFEDSLEARVKEDIPEEYASVIDAIKQGIPVSEWISLVAPNEELKNADLDDEETQEILVGRLLEKQGLSEDKIDKKISRLKTLGTLKDEAEEAQAILIKEDEKLKSENNRKIIENRKEQEKRQKDTITKIYKDAESLSEVEGVFLTKKERKELADYITKPVNTKGETQYMLDRNNPDILLQAAYLVKNAKTGVVSKVAKSKAAINLKKELDRRSDKMSSGRGRDPKEGGRSNRMSNAVLWDSIKEIED